MPDVFVDDLTNQVLGGQFKILEPVGKGAMAMVYRAYQASMDRVVAVKMLLGEYTRQPDFLERFEREAKVTARLNHINILPIYHYDQFEGVPYLVVPFINTGTLADLMHPGSLPVSEVLRLSGQIAAALDHAHNRDVIHRDVKPSNVLIDADGNALLCDFGLAKLTTSGAATLTADSLIGTPYYMSPEQCSGLSIDARSDIYALGVLIYEMMTGAPPFSGPTPLATVLQHIDAPIPDVPGAPHLNPFIKRALAKNPDQRYQTASEMVEALRYIEEVNNDVLYEPIGAVQPGSATIYQTRPLEDEELIPETVEIDMSQVPALLDRFHTPALAEAARLAHGFLGVEHVFMALARSPGGLLVRVLAAQGVDVIEVIQAIDGHIGRGDGPLFKGGPRPTPRLMRVLQAAADAARRQHRFVPTPHELVIAMFREGESVPVRYLGYMGVDLAAVLGDLEAEYAGAVAAFSAHIDPSRPAPARLPDRFGDVDPYAPTEADQ
ncbi:MAG: protein kinase [Anaerolineae bacterium]|nr:protein kinase [Anaerolineae bacterium]